MAINGNNIIIKKGDTAIAGTRSHEIEVDGDLIEIASPSTGAWRSYITGRKSWSVNVSYLVPAAANVRDILTVGTSYTLVISDRNNSNTVTGTAILTKCKQTYTRGNLVQGSFVFQGTSSLT